jgi:hypothetical protein
MSATAKIHLGPPAVILRYFDGCPNAGLAHTRLAEALRRVGLDPAIITLEEVSTAVDAERLGFRGSPTILIDGHDPFDDNTGHAPARACRIYQTETGPQGSPTVVQLEQTLRR